MVVNLYVINSPFDENQATQLNQIIQNLTIEQQVWLSGYLTANLQSVTTKQETPSEVAQFVLNKESTSNSERHITVLYGSETGNAQGLAEKLADRLVELNFNVKLSAMGDYKTKDLKKVEDLFIISSSFFVAAISCLHKPFCSHLSYSSSPFCNKLCASAIPCFSSAFSV